MERYNRLIDHMLESLINLRRAIVGEIIMSDELEEMFNAFLVNAVPESWKKFSYPSLKSLGAWYDDFIDRINFFKAWLVEIP